MLTDPRYCAHPNAVPVEVDGETVAALCPDCDDQLTADWLDCEHPFPIGITVLGERPGRMFCNGCRCRYWAGDLNIIVYH